MNPDTKVSQANSLQKLVGKRIEINNVSVAEKQTKIERTRLLVRTTRYPH
jgi:hypothetical protein